MGKTATVVGTVLACASSFIVLYFNNLMDYMQLFAILFVSPFFIVFLLGMFWKRPSATAGFLGMIAGLSGATLEYVLYRLHVLKFYSPMASNIWTAMWGFVPGLVVTVVASYLTTPPREEASKKLVYSRALAKPGPLAWYSTPKFYAAIIVAVFIVLNWKFFKQTPEEDRAGHMTSWE